MRAAKELVEQHPVSRDALEGPLFLSNLAALYAWAGEKDRAFEVLSTLVRTPYGGLSYGAFKFDPTWDSLRDDPRFAHLLAQVTQPVPL